MKRIGFIAMACVWAVTMCAQTQKEVTKFLGIPVDGTKSEMVQKLKEKGFESSMVDENVLTGEFNGTDVYVYVVTNNNKVYRIMLADKNWISEADIKIRFNNLCHQFENNKKYTAMGDTVYTIQDEEDISYEMGVRNKRYRAVYYQKSAVADSIALCKAKAAYPNLLATSSEEEAEKIINNSVYLDTFFENLNRTVWFMISEYYGKYYIAMYYYNEYNKANGEDL